MNLAFYIHELLFRYPCVIVPDFGAFLTETYSAQLHANEQSIHPPGKKVFFNAYIQNNDGLLVQYLVQKKLGTTDEAIGLIKNTVVSWKKDLSNGLPLELKNIGTFTLNDQSAMVFEPNAFNYAKSSFGLTSAKAVSSKSKGCSDCNSCRCRALKSIQIIYNNSCICSFDLVNLASFSEIPHEIHAKVWYGLLPDAAGL